MRAELQHNVVSNSGRSLAEFVATRKFRNWLTLGLVVLGPLLILATFIVLGGLEQTGNQTFLRAVILADIVYVITIAGLIAGRVARMMSARRVRSAGSKLHMRLTRVFTLIALVPTVVVAIFATITLNFGLEGWFSDRVRQVVGNSLAAAQAYESEHKVNLSSDARLLARFLNDQKVQFPLISEAEFRVLLERGQKQIQRGLTEAYVIDGGLNIQARGERSYLFGFDPPTPADIALARRGEIVIIEDWEKDEFRALAVIPAFADRFLYVSRDVDGEILSLLDQTKETITLYQQLESDRGRLLFEFALIYLGFALIVILASIWGALWFAERLARPVGVLAAAAERVGLGDLNVRIKASNTDDEIAMLGRTFNRMTEQVKGQQDALIEANEETEKRRRLFDSVLSGVTAGVIGLDSDGHIEVCNNAAEQMLRFDGVVSRGKPIGEVVPEFQPLFESLALKRQSTAVTEVEVERFAAIEKLMARIGARSVDGVVEGYVITFDDITDLVSAQRTAAWGDVARRIAHEIKNPLTPIQLSAERLRRKFLPVAGEEKDALNQYADVIIRQTEDLRKIVDEFSKFARMPAADMRRGDIINVIKGALLLIEGAHTEIMFKRDFNADVIEFDFDETMMSQVFNNVLKNAAEAIEAKTAASDAPYQPEVRVITTSGAGVLTIRVQDNGIGLPEQRATLFEPYVTHRDKGTGLGLSIVKKIVEEHNGQMELRDAPVFDGNEGFGAEVKISFFSLDGQVRPNSQKHKQVA